MNRNLSLERTYKIGDMHFVKVGDTIEDIPEELMFNPEVTSTLRMLQIIQIEKAFFNYMKKKDIYHAHSVVDALALIEDDSNNTVRKLKDILKDEIEEGE